MAFSISFNFLPNFIVIFEIIYFIQLYIMKIRIIIKTNILFIPIYSPFIRRLYQTFNSLLIITISIILDLANLINSDVLNGSELYYRLYTTILNPDNTTTIKNAEFKSKSKSESQQPQHFIFKEFFINLPILSIKVKLNSIN